MTSQIPDGEGWSWSLEEGVTLMTYAPGSGRPGALVYVEAFSPEIHQHPAAEHLRFQSTVDPELAESYLQFAGAGVAWGARAAGAHRGPSEAARWSQLLKTRTQGRGLGFRPTPGTFTGWRWVGRNAQDVTIRCGRHLGTWREPRSLPASLAKSLAGKLEPSPEAAAAMGVSASLILGSATDRDEETGVHFAILCAREPRCLVYKDLAQWLASIQIADGPLLERLRSAPPIAFQELVDRSGLKITSSCDCSGNLYDCPDFPTHDEAQSCFDHCRNLGKGDIHQLDQDKDGNACECDPRIKGRCVHEW